MGDLNRVTVALSNIAAMAAGDTLSATRLAWSHAQYVRLAWSIVVGHPVEQPSFIAERYGGATTSPLATAWPEGNPTPAERRTSPLC
jgi:hypothetical protein